MTIQVVLQDSTVKQTFTDIREREGTKDKIFGKKRSTKCKVIIQDVMKDGI